MPPLVFHCYSNSARRPSQPDGPRRRLRGMPATQLTAGCPRRMRAAGNTFRQFEFAYRAVGDPGGVENDAVRGVRVHVSGQGDKVAVVFTRRADPWRHRGLTPVDAVAE